MKKVSIITLSLVMLMNGSLVFSAPRKRRNSGGVVPTATTTATVPTISLQNVSEVQSLQIEPDYITSNEDKEELKNLLSNLQSNIEKAKSSCSGIRDDLKTIQVLAGVSTGASSLGTLTSGGALVTGIMKAKTDKTIEELENQINKIKLLESKTENLSDNQEEFLKQLETIIPELNADVSALEGKIADETKKSQTLGNVRTGLMAGSIATSATSTITSGINIKKLDDLIAKMKDCDKSANQIKSDISMIESEIDNVDDLKDNASFTKAKNITQSCTGFDTNNIKDIKGVMTASTVVGGVGTAVSTAGTITSAIANSKDVRKDDSDKGKKKEKGLNLASTIMAGVSTGTSAGGIVLGAVALKKLSDNVDVAEKCEDALK